MTQDIWPSSLVHTLPPKTLAGLAAVYAALALPAAPAMPVSALLASAVLAAALIVLTVIDLETMRLPNTITVPLALAGLALTGLLGWDSIAWRLASAAIGFGAAYLTAHAYLALRGRSGLGLGDAKLLAASGAWVGAEGLTTVVLYACGAALLAASLSHVRRGSLSRTTAIPFGPFLAAGTWLVWLYGPVSISV